MSGLDQQRSDLLAFTLRLGDDALVLGQRLAEWCSRAPFLEEDLALANTALDFLGRARFLYQYAAEIEGAGRTEDDFAYTRDAGAYRNLLVLELPRGDFAFTMARQFCVDVFDVHYLGALQGSADRRLAAIAGKGLKEAQYHLKRSRAWVLRLGDGTAESRRRLQQALGSLMPYLGELFELDALERRLVDGAVAPDRADLHGSWSAEVGATLEQATVGWPEAPAQPEQRRGGRAGQHTPHLAELLDELQAVTRALPGRTW
ncbi:MAG: 1,2-phenylacetyl-CoA epoxidase subunit PaaC [Pseudomonadales bacterium]